MDQDTRDPLLRRGRMLELLSLTYNCVEAFIAIAAGLSAGSVALFGFGLDSVIESMSSATMLWRLGARVDRERRDAAERRALRIIGASFLALAVYIVYDSVRKLWYREQPESSAVGIALAVASVILMPLLARAKHRVAHGLHSASFIADTRQTVLCAWLSVILLLGLLLNALFGCWWADPVAALAMTPIVVREGIRALRGRHCCEDHLGPPT